MSLTSHLPTVTDRKLAATELSPRRMTKRKQPALPTTIPNAGCAIDLKLWAVRARMHKDAWRASRSCTINVGHMRRWTLGRKPKADRMAHGLSIILLAVLESSLQRSSEPSCRAGEGSRDFASRQQGCVIPQRRQTPMHPLQPGFCALYTASLDQDA